MTAHDYSNAIAVTRDIHWIGFYDETANLHCNPYLLIDGDEAVLFDPGSIPHFPIVMRKLIDLVNPASISAIVASHQDPDVCGNLAVVEDVIGRSDLQIIAHSNTMRLIRHYGIRSSQYCVDDHDCRYQLQSGRVLEFIPTPYLHSPGAICTWDAQTGSLFSSDLFGALSNQWSLFARNDFLEPLCTFHRLYMPSPALLRQGLEPLRGLPIQRILPQHGSILENNQVGEAFTALLQLQCGINQLETHA